MIDLCPFCNCELLIRKDIFNKADGFCCYKCFELKKYNGLYKYSIKCKNDWNLIEELDICILVREIYYYCHFNYINKTTTIRFITPDTLEQVGDLLEFDYLPKIKHTNILEDVTKFVNKIDNMKIYS